MQSPEESFFVQEAHVPLRHGRRETRCKRVSMEGKMRVRDISELIADSTGTLESKRGR
jgi:hypothetical protein